MKKSSIILLAFVSLPTFAVDDILNALLEHTPTISSSSTKANEEAKDVGKTETKSLVTGKTCLDLNIDKQKSLPLKVIIGLIQEEPRSLNFSHNAASGLLTISSPKRISNCDDMVEWKVAQTSLSGENAYSVEAKIKEGHSCKDGKCTFKMWKIENGSKKVVEKEFSPDFSGFKACLAESGVFKKGSSEAVKDAIHYEKLNFKANGIKDSGKVVFVSEGPDSSQIGAMYGDFDVVSDCRYFEDVAEEPVSLISHAEVLKRERDRQAAELEKCTVNDYQKIADFLEAYEQDYAYLRPILNDLLETAAKDAAKRFAEGTDTPADLEILKDFQEIVVNPLTDQADRLFEEAEELDGEERTRKLAQLKGVLERLKSYSEKPFFDQALTDKFIKDGRFDAAKQMNSLRLVLTVYPKLGTKVGNQVLTPDAVINFIGQKQDEYAVALEEEEELYLIRTGQDFSHTEELNELIAAAQRRLRNRTAQMQSYIQEAYQKMTRSCPLFGTFAQTCQRKAMEDIQEYQRVIQAEQAHYHKTIAAIQPELQKYRALEAQGREYLKAQGQEAPPEVTASTESTDPNVYTMNFNQGPGLQPPMMGQMPQQPYMGAAAMNPYTMMQGQQGMFMGAQNPYMMSGYQQPFMGQNGAYAQFGFQGGMGGQYGMNPYGMSPYGMSPYGGMGMQMPQMGGYMNYGMGGMGMGGMGQQPMGQPAMFYPGMPTY
jgi:hypothetical protein